MIRSTILLALLGSLAWWLHGEQEKGRLRQIDEGFLDFLLANTRDELKPDPAKLDRVVFVAMNESEKAEYSAWPPAPLDYHMIVKALAAYEPEVVVITETLSWPEPKPQFIDQLGSTLRPFPHVVTGVRASSNAGDLAFARERLPVVTNVRGKTDALPLIGSIESVPEPELVRVSDAGVLTTPVSIGQRLDDGIAPSLEMQVLAHALHVPFAHQRIVIGPGAGLHLGDEFFVPLNVDGSFTKASVTVPEVNAVDVMTPVGAGVDVTIPKGRILVIGKGDDETRQRVQIMAASLALPTLSVVSFAVEVVAWSLAALLALWMLSMPRTKAFMRAFLFLFAALTASYLAFQAMKVWCPPAIPAAIIVAGGLFARCFGRRVAAQP